MKFGLNENSLEQINSVFREFSEIEETIIFGREQKVISEKARILISFLKERILTVIS